MRNDGKQVHKRGMMSEREDKKLVERRLEAEVEREGEGERSI